MNLDRVTMTGADDSVSPLRLAELSEEYPFVEWGILLSASNRETPRFPSLRWLAALYGTYLDHPHMTLSFHVCGRWVREICGGNWTPLFVNTGKILDVGKRVQLNFHSCAHLLAPTFVPHAIERCKEQNWQVIFQCDGVNDYLVSSAYVDGLDAVPLYDKSGGAGVVPDSWPEAMRGIYSGYAGGLGPDNLQTELSDIADAARDERFWIDMETKVRTSSDRQFDLTAVRACLDIAAPYVAKVSP